MVVTVVHNDTDNINFHIKILREGLSQVKPRVDFKPCWVWDFTDRVFDENRTVLVIISNKCESFRKKVLDSFQKYKRRCNKVKCRMCVVFETDRNTIEEDFDSLIGQENISVVQDLFQSVKWLPKVCAFLFKTKRRGKASTCVIPKVRNESKVGKFRDNLVESLQELDINVSEELERTLPRCCVFFRNGDEYDIDASLRYITAVKNLIGRSGGTIFEYNPSYNDELKMDPSNEIMYGKDSYVLFFIHILYVMEVLDVKTVLGQRLRRINRPHVVCFGCCWSYESNIASIIGIRDGWSVEKGQVINVKVSGDKNDCGIRGCCFMPGGELVLCDYSNDKIKVLDRSLSVVDSLDLYLSYCFPWKVTAVDNSNVIVLTMPLTNKQIQFIQVLPSLRLVRTINVDAMCQGVAVAAGKIFVSCYNYDDKVVEIRVYDLDGRDLGKRLGIKPDGSSLFRRLEYIAVSRSGDKVFVSDLRTNTVSCLTSEGTIVYQYRDDELIYPQGLFVDDNDNVIVCGANTVQVITAAGKKHKTLLSRNDGISKPQCVSFRPSDGTLVVCCWESNYLLSFFISI